MRTINCKQWVFYFDTALFAYDMSPYETPMFYYLMHEIPLSIFPYYKTSDLRDGLDRYLCADGQQELAMCLKIGDVTKIIDKMINAGLGTYMLKQKCVSGISVQKRIGL
jgi:hypothetical protein